MEETLDKCRENDCSVNGYKRKKPPLKFSLWVHWVTVPDLLSPVRAKDKQLYP